MEWIYWYAYPTLALHDPCHKLKQPPSDKKQMCKYPESILTMNILIS